MNDQWMPCHLFTLNYMISAALTLWEVRTLGYVTVKRKQTMNQSCWWIVDTYFRYELARSRDALVIMTLVPFLNNLQELTLIRVCLFVWYIYVIVRLYVSMAMALRRTIPSKYYFNR